MVVRQKHLELRTGSSFFFFFFGPPLAPAPPPAPRFRRPQVSLTFCSLSRRFAKKPCARGDVNFFPVFPGFPPPPFRFALLSFSVVQSAQDRTFSHTFQCFCGCRIPSMAFCFWSLFILTPVRPARRFFFGRRPTLPPLNLPKNPSAPSPGSPLSLPEQPTRPPSVLPASGHQTRAKITSSPPCRLSRTPRSPSQHPHLPLLLGSSIQTDPTRGQFHFGRFDLMIPSPSPFLFRRPKMSKGRYGRSARIFAPTKFHRETPLIFP